MDCKVLIRVLCGVLLLSNSFLLTGCGAGGGPSNAEAQEVIYGLFFQDVRIIEKRQCELLPWMEEDGQTNVWLVRYRFKESGSEAAMLLTETDSEEYPWQRYLAGMDHCPSPE
jgi:hypothetical protein